jgi:multidrug efflux pump subunit AcrB
MKLIQTSINRPVSVIVGILLLSLFGYISIKNMPIQMKPTVDKPIITISTAYPGAAPQEVEEQITRASSIGRKPVQAHLQICRRKVGDKPGV